MLVKLALPKGSLQESTFELMRKAGFHCTVSSRSYSPWVDDEELEIMLIRAQEIGRYVEDEVFDAGLTGKDWIVETGADVVEVAELVYAKHTRQPLRWVLAAPEASDIHSVQDLEGKRIATEVVNITEAYLQEARRERESGILLGRHGSQGPGTGRRDRGNHRNGRFDPGQQASDPRYLDGVHQPAHREQNELAGPGQAAQDREHRLAAQRRHARRGDGRSEDERETRRPRRRSPNCCPRCRTPLYPPWPIRSGWPSK